MKNTSASNLVIVGCGNIGMRHLEGLLKLKRNTTISVVEPRLQARELAQLHLSKLQYDKQKHSVNWYESIEKLDARSDLAIIATTSVGRVNLINQMLEMNHLRFLIEKVVCQSIEEYDLLLSNMKKFNAKGWINTNRRYFHSYQQIKKLFPSDKPLHLVISAGNKGLGSNAVHYIDLFNWFIENDKTELDGTSLNSKIFPNKRSPDLLEFAGTITGHNGMSSLTITFLLLDDMPITVDISNETRRVLIDEINEKIISIKGQDPKIEFKYEHVSALTTRIAEDILQNDNCYLPTAEQTYHTHKEIFRIFNSHIKKILNEDRRLCPIT